MLFSSIEYLAVFLPIVLVVSWLTPPHPRRWVLLVASYSFYGWWDWRLLLLLGLTTVSTWIGAAVIARLSSEAARRLVLVYALALSGGVLLVFKYYAFFLGSIDDAGSQAQLSFGLDVGLGGVELLVPVGLSFYTFQSISYLVDVYRRELKPCRSLLDYALYVAFFPHLLAGPILRARRLLPKIQDLPLRPSPVQTAEGLELILLGLFKKVAVADPLVRSSVTSAVAGAQDGPPGAARVVVSLLLAIVGGFFDISGYIDLARGSAKLLGIDMQHNMAEPLTRSRNLTELYRRWQITIMSWFRDYVFLPLRGRGHAGELRESAALFGTFLAVAVWHGITVGWLMFGLLTGGLMVAERTLRTRRVARQRADRLARREARRGGAKVAVAPPRTGLRAAPPWLRAAVGIAYVYAALVATHVWVVVGDLGTGFRIYSWALGLGPGGIGSFDLEALVILAYGIAVLVLTDRRQRKLIEREGAWDPPSALRAVAFGAMATGVLVFAGSASEPFIYFQF